MIELEAQSEVQNRDQQEQDVNDETISQRTPIIEVDLTAKSPSERPEVSVIRGKRISHKSR